MLVQPIQEAQPTHVVVLASEKGGSGKSTTALHIAVALLKAGQRVATVDLDSRQKTFTRYIENRRAWAAHAYTSGLFRASGPRGNFMLRSLPVSLHDILFQYCLISP